MSDDFSPYGLNHVAQARRKLERGEPCSHPGCLSHVSHPCEGCGRVGGTITLEEALAIEVENKRLADENARLKAEIDALKARRCETCKYGRRISDIAYECKRTHADLVMWAHDGCSRWEQSKKKREAADV